MEKWIILFSTAICFLVITLTIYFYRRKENRSGRQLKSTGIIIQYWQAIVLIALGVILLVVYLFL